METLFDNFGVLFIAVAILIVKALFRKAAAAGEEAEEPMRETVEAEPYAGERRGEMGPGIPSAETARARMAAQKQINARKAERQSKREGRQRAAQVAVSPSQAAVKRQQHPVPPPAPAASQSTTDRNEWMEGFDIRRAVVWSEILRPKFEEDEA